MMAVAAKAPGLIDLEPAEAARAGLPRWELLKLLVSLYWSMRGRFACMTVLQLGRALSLGASVFFLNRATASFLAGTEPDVRFALEGGACCLGLALAALCTSCADAAERWFKEGVSLSSFRWMLGNALLLPADYFRTHAIHAFVETLLKSQLLVTVVIDYLTVFVSATLVIVTVSVGVLAQLSWYAALALTAVVGLAAFVMRRTTQLRLATRGEHQQDMQFLDQALAVFANLQDLQNYGLRERTQQQLEDWCGTLAQRASELARLREQASVWLNGVGFGVVAALALLCIWLGQQPAAVLTTFAALVVLLDPLSKIVRAVQVVVTRLSRLETLLQVVGQAHHQRQQQGEATLPEPMRVLRLDDLSYAVKGTPLLRNISCELRRGSIIGLIGRSGAGKTTLANILLRVLDHSSGELLVDGRAVRGIALQSYWQQCAYVAQVPCAFGDTLAEQVALARADADDAAIVQALRAAGIDPALRAEKLTAVSCRDAAAAWQTRSLQQRVEWARLTLRPAALVVLDEPASLVDPAHEQRLLRHLLAEREQRITLLISHRLSTLAICDRLLVLERGALVADGPPAQILPQWLGCLDEAKEHAS